MDLDLEDNHSLIFEDNQDTKPNTPESEIKVLRSKDSNNSTRLAIYDGVIDGVIEKDGERICITPLFCYTPDHSKSLVVYNVKDIKKEIKKDSPKRLSQFNNDVLNETVQTRSSSDFTNIMRFVKIATHADYAFYKKYGYNTRNRIISLVNASEGLFKSTFKIRLLISSHEYPFTSEASDKYKYFTLPNNATDQDHINRAAIFLGSIRTYWSFNPTQAERDVILVFSGRNFGPVEGMAYTGMQCNRGKNYVFIASDDANTTMHELGHVFGAGHVNDGSIMNEYGDGNYFSSTSINQIKSHMTNVSCVTTVTIPNLTISGSSQVGLRTENFYFANTIYNEPALTYHWTLDGVPLSYTSYAVPVRFSHLEAGYHTLICQTEKTVTVNGVSYRIKGDMFLKSIIVGNSYRSAQADNDFLVENQSNTLCVTRVEDQAEIKVKNNNNNISYQLNNVMSGMVLSKGVVNTDHGTIDVSYLPKGIYVLTLIAEDGYRETHKIAIQ